MITNYKLYEAKFGNVSKIITKDKDSDIYKKIINYKSDFQFDEELVNNVFLPSYNINMNIIWYNNENHLITKRITQRTELYSMSEFNELIRKTIIYLFKNYFDQITVGNNKYDLYLTETKIHILILIDYFKIFEDNPFIQIITILPQDCVNCSKLLEIPY